MALRQLAVNERLFHSKVPNEKFEEIGRHAKTEKVWDPFVTENEFLVMCAQNFFCHETVIGKILSRLTPYCKYPGILPCARYDVATTKSRCSVITP